MTDESAARLTLAEAIAKTMVATIDALIATGVIL